MPDPRNLGGDFSNLLALGSQYQIYDPATIRAAANGRFSIEPFSGNVLPASRIDPIALKLAGHYPKPNDTGRPDGTNNFNVQSRPSPRSYYNHLARVDHVISDKQRIYVRGAIHRQLLGPYRNYWDDVATSNFQFGKDRQLAVDDVYMFSPSMVLNVRYGYSRWAGGHTPRKIGYDMTELGFSKQIADIASPQWKMFPRVSIAGMQTLGSETIIDVLNEDIHSFFASLTKQTGKHSMKFGTDLRAYRDNLFYPGDASPTFTFSTNYTRGPFDNSASSPNGLGQGLASFLLGIPTGGYVDRNDSQANQSTYWSFYFHDNFRATQKLTLDMGLRWEYEGPLTERFNRSVRGFDPNATHALEPLAQAAYAAAPDPALRPDQFRVRGGLLFAGVNGAPRTQWDRSLRNFAPRFGFAYQAMKDTVLRGGFGVYFGQIGVPYQTHTIQSGFNQSTQIIPSQDNGLTFTATLSNPFPSGVLAAPKASLGADTFLGQAISFYSTAAKTPETLRWDFNIQRLLPGQLLMEIGYNGSKSIRQLNRRDQSMRNVNPVPNAFLSTSPVRDNTTNDFLTFNITNPFAGLLPGSSLNSAKIGRSQFLRPYPEFTGISATDYQSYSWYHALRLRTERRFHNGFTAQAAYTFSKTMDASEYLNGGDAAPTRVISTLDRPHHFAFSGIFELPVGKGRRVFANAGRAANALLGGWQAGSVWQLVSGEPLNFGNVLFLGNIKDIALPANRRTVDRWINTGAGFVTSVTQQLVSNLRTFPLRFSGIRADRVNGWDFSLIKSTNVGEHRQIQFRAEFLNAFNHPNAFAPPDTSPTSSAFGRITSMYSTPRTIQLGGKYVF